MRLSARAETCAQRLREARDAQDADDIALWEERFEAHTTPASLYQDPTPLLDWLDLRRAVLRTIAKLDPQEAHVLYLRYGLLDGVERILEEVGALTPRKGPSRRVPSGAVRRRRPRRRQEAENPRILRNTSMGAAQQAYTSSYPIDGHARAFILRADMVAQSGIADAQSSFDSIITAALRKMGVVEPVAVLPLTHTDVYKRAVPAVEAIVRRQRARLEVLRADCMFVRLTDHKGIAVEGYLRAVCLGGTT